VRGRQEDLGGEERAQVKTILASNAVLVVLQSLFLASITVVGKGAPGTSKKGGPVFGGKKHRSERGKEVTIRSSQRSRLNKKGRMGGPAGSRRGEEG